MSTTMLQPETCRTSYGSVVLAPDGTRLSHVFGAGIDQGAAPLREETLGQMLRTIVQRHPSRDCIVDVYADVSFSFERFYNRVLRLASAFIRKGYRRGDRVGIWSTNRWEWLVVQWACHHLGLVLVNINPAYRQSELNYVLEKSGVKMVFAARRYKDSDYRTMLNEAAMQRGSQLQRVIYFGSPDWYDAMHGEIDDLSVKSTRVVYLPFR